MTVYEKIDHVLKQHENHKYCERSLDSIADYINWAWKWKRLVEKKWKMRQIVCVHYMMLN